MSTIPPLRRGLLRRRAFSASLSLAAAGSLLPTQIVRAQDAPEETSDQPAAPVNLVRFADDASFLDRIEVRVAGLAAPPAGQAYRVWLRSESGPSTLYTGELAVSEGGEGALAFSEPRGETLLAEYSQVVVSLESGAAPPLGVPSALAGGVGPTGPVVLRGQVDEGALVHLRRLLVRWPDSRYGTASLQGMRQLATAARGHAAVLREAGVIGDLQGMRRKAEHLVNMIEGQRGASFGDHNGDGRTEDPGDGVGFLSYAWAALTHTQFAWATAGDEALAARALEVQRPVRFALEWAGFVRDTGLELARTADLARAREQATHLSRAVDRVAASVDPSADAALRQALDDFTGGQLTPAYAEALTLVRMPLA